MNYQIFASQPLPILESLQSECVDLIIADLSSWKSKQANKEFPSLWKECKRILKKNHVCILFSMQPVSSLLIANDYKWFKHNWVWVKNKKAGGLNAKSRPMIGHEDILIFSQGGASARSKNQMPYYPQGLQHFAQYQQQKKRFSLNQATQIPDWKQVYSRPCGKYPDTVLCFECNNTQISVKPTTLMEFLALSYTKPQETILSFSMRGDSSGIAAIRNDRKFIGIKDTASEMKQMEDVLLKEQLQTELFKSQLVSSSLF